MYCSYINTAYTSSIHVIPGTILDRVVKIGKSPVRCVFREPKVERVGYVSGIGGHVDSIRQLGYSDSFNKRGSEEHQLVYLFTYF